MKAPASSTDRARQGEAAGDPVAAGGEEGTEETAEGFCVMSAILGRPGAGREWPLMLV
ncbi:hypothetical protein SMD11_5355 [Streptomyces albireticuli]|uniref:Uncharacterized protein n=1 Tax=Streptomyces albireticuli TaxID=1940 RepID=A0A1Z2L9G4_9ACTN|nr:hypothetical protein SMD11_5355 [Streptomyces albireticuli]